MGAGHAMPSMLILSLRLGFACLLGGIIGWQRERVNRPAGFRTHVLVATGSALIMLISVHGFSEGGQTQDPARLAAQVVSGIGFLGAGTIMKEGLTVKGLTTAASLWVVAAIGLATGVGFFVPAIVTTVLVYLSLTSFSLLEQSKLESFSILISLIADDRPGLLGDIGTVLGDKNANIRNICLDGLQGDVPAVRVDMELRLPRNTRLQDVIASLASVAGVRRVDETMQ